MGRSVALHDKRPIQLIPAGYVSYSAKTNTCDTISKISIYAMNGGKASYYVQDGWLIRYQVSLPIITDSWGIRGHI